MYGSHLYPMLPSSLERPLWEEKAHTVELKAECQSMGLCALHI